MASDMTHSEIADLERSSSQSFNDVCIFIVPRKLPKARIQKLYDIARKRGMRISQEASDVVTHIVTAYESLDQVKVLVNMKTHQHVVSVDWLTNCFSENKVLRVTERFTVGYKSAEKIQEMAPKDNSKQEVEELKYECMKGVTLNYPNKKIVSALETLEKDAQYKGDEARALAFRRASCSIKSCGRELKETNDVMHLSYVGKHATRVVKDVLENGISLEANEILCSERYQAFKLFNGIYGCGPATSKAWYNLGLRTLRDIESACENGSITLTGKQKMGLRYYEDLAEPVNKEESEQILECIKAEVARIYSEATVELVGGQRRGKYSGHDVDVFICTKEDHQTGPLLRRLVARLNELGMVLYVETQIGQNNLDALDEVSGSSLNDDEEKHRKKKSQMDHLDKAFTILQFPSKTTTWAIEGNSDAKRRRTDMQGQFKARRVDLIVSPPSQYIVARFGWTGSKHLNRSLRLYAWRQKSITISNHAIWDHHQQPPSRINVSDEEEIFKLLDLNYLQPEERNH